MMNNGLSPTRSLTSVSGQLRSTGVLHAVVGISRKPYDGDYLDADGTEMIMVSGPADASGDNPLMVSASLVGKSHADR